MSRKYEITKILNAYNRVINEDHVEGQLENPHINSASDIAITAIPINTKVGHECASNSEETNNDMAKSELFSIIKDGSDLLDLIESGSHEISPWMLSKLTRASDYLNSVKKVLEYSNFEKFCSKEDEQDMHSGLRLAHDIQSMLGGEGMEVNEAVLKNVIFNIECLKETLTN